MTHPACRLTHSAAVGTRSSAMAGRGRLRYHHRTQTVAAAMSRSMVWTRMPMIGPAATRPALSQRMRLSQPAR